jgi:hypothetical protein
MKMAKASEADMSMAIEMAQALDALTNRWTPMMPEAIDQGGEEENERFDIDDETQCRRVVEYLLELADRASLFRVVFGMAVLLDPQNEIVDPAADHLATHPKFDAAAKDAERYRLLRRGQHWSVVDGIGDTLRADALDAAIDAVTEDTSNDEAHRGARQGASGGADCSAAT